MRGFVILATVSIALAAHVESSNIPFQVSIELKSTGASDASQYHLCNGIIIHEMYILTTANCLYFPIMNTNISIQLTATDITVVAGLRNSSNNTLYRNVVSIIPHHKFNKTTYDNDMAVLKLDSALPLANNKEIQWLNVASSRDTHGSNESCFSTVFNSAEKNEGLYSITKSHSNLQHSVCTDAQVPATHQMDLCLEYSISSINLKYSRERGTAYVCNNKLVGLLADINPPKSVEKCLLNQQTTGFYVNVALYIDWLLEVTQLPQFDVSSSTNATLNIPSWTSPTESPILPPSGVSTSKPGGAARNLCSSAVLFILLTLLMNFSKMF